jgi:hypothetical protein
MDQNDNQPKYRAYSVIERAGRRAFWAPIGGAFAHNDGLGLNVVLSALPIDGKVVLRPAKEKQSVEAPE